jgi:large conductance mechanosensitive channel
MSLLQEFKAFAMRGNVVDLAVGVVIGGAFGKIVSSLVNDIVMPPLNLLTAKSGANFNSLSLKYSQVFGSKIDLPKMDKGAPVLDSAGKAIIESTDPDLLKYGPFLQTTLDFIIVAFAIFMMVRLMNALQRKKEEAPAAPAPTPEDIALLREIRDSLAKSSPRRVD